MSEQGIQRVALLFMAGAAAAASRLWAQHDDATAVQRASDTTLAAWLSDTDARVSDLIGATVVDDAGNSIGEILDFVVSAGGQGTRAIVGLEREASGARGRLVAVPFTALHVELSVEGAPAVPQQARVRVELSGTPLEALPAYEYPKRGAI